MNSYDAYGDMPCWHPCETRTCKWNQFGACRDNCTCENLTPRRDEEEKEEDDET